MHQLCFNLIKPVRLPKQADPGVQKAYIANYKRLNNDLPPDEKVIFIDAVHTEHQFQATLGWFHKNDRPEVRTMTGRQRVNIQRVLDLVALWLVHVQGERIDKALPEAIDAFLKDTLQQMCTRFRAIVTDNLRIITHYERFLIG